MDVRFLLATLDPENVSISPFPAVYRLQDAQSSTIRRRPNSDDAHSYDHNARHLETARRSGSESCSNDWRRPATSVSQRAPPALDTLTLVDYERTSSEYTYRTASAGVISTDDNPRYTNNFSSGRPASPDSTSDSNSHSDLTMDNKPRPPRPAYNEEQRFYIMFCRIVLFQSWPEIEHGFGDLFGKNAVPRSRGGLTSVYYRVRKRWGLEEVLKTDSEATHSDRVEVGRRAQWMSPEFLNRIGYPATYQVA